MPDEKTPTADCSELEQSGNILNHDELKEIIQTDKRIENLEESVSLDENIEKNSLTNLSPLQSESSEPKLEKLSCIEQMTVITSDSLHDINPVPSEPINDFSDNKNFIENSDCEIPKKETTNLIDDINKNDYSTNEIVGNEDLSRTLKDNDISLTAVEENFLNEETKSENGDFLENELK